jgi:hypothetical protein
MDEEVPWEIKLTLRPGSVYYFVDRHLTPGEPHYFIVVNVQPLEDQVLVLTVISSQVEKVERRKTHLPGTTVRISPAEYEELTKPSIVDGNFVVRKSLAELVAKMRRKEIVPKRDLPGNILHAIQQAILASPLVEEEVKRLLRK